MAEDFIYSEGLELEQSSQPSTSNSQTEASVHDSHLAPDGSAGSTNAPEYTHFSENLQSPELEDLDSYNPIEPPPLDWRSDSSSEAGSVAELEICSVGDFEAHESFNIELNEDVMSVVNDCGAQDSSKDLLAQEICEIKPEISVCQTQDAQQERQETNGEDKDGKCINPEMNTGKIKEKENDIDHTHIQSLLTQLHLFKPSTSVDSPAAFALDHGTLHNLHTPAESTASSLQELEFSAQSACAHSDANVPEALLFSHEYQKDLLQLLEDPETEELRTAPEFVHTRLVTPEHQSGLRRQSSDADEGISVSHSQDAWHKHLQDEFLVSGVAEDEQWTPSEGLTADRVSTNNDLDAETQPAYKNVPGPCDPEDLLDGVIFGAKYLGSTQLQSEKNPSTNARMAQAQEAVDRIKVEELVVYDYGVLVVHGIQMEGRK